MHEAALAEHIVDIVCRAAAREQATRVASVRVLVGDLAAVMPEALASAFAAASVATLLAGARLDLVSEPGQARCLDCGATCAIHEPLAPCPRCQGHALRITGGDALRVLDMEVC